MDHYLPSVFWRLWDSWGLRGLVGELEAVVIPALPDCCCVILCDPAAWACACAWAIKAAAAAMLNGALCGAM